MPCKTIVPRDVMVLSLASLGSSPRACVPAALFCCLLAFLVPGQQAEAFDVRKCMYSTEKAVMYRNSDDRISCVSLGSVDDLVKRGWGEHNPYDPVVVEIVQFGSPRVLTSDPIFNQEITRFEYDTYAGHCAKKFNSFRCNMQLNNGTIQEHLFNFEIKKYFTVDWDR